MNRVSKALLVRRCLTNWIEVGRSLARLEKSYANHMADLLDMHFKSGVDIENIALCLVGPLLIYFDHAKRLGIFSNSDLRSLTSVAKDVDEKLGRAFTSDELASFSAGGLFNSKTIGLFLIVRKWLPSTVVETGVGQGISSYVILKALQINGKGRLISVDAPNRNPRGYVYSDGTHDLVYTPSSLEPGWVVPSELRSFWELRVGPSSEVLPTIGRDVDIFYHDSEHSYQNMTFEFEWAYSRLKNGGILVSDDVSWNEAFFDFARKHRDLTDLSSMFNIFDTGILIKLSIKPERSAAVLRQLKKFSLCGR